MKFMRKGLIWIHRYLGIVLSLLFVVWFLSGIGMMFARGMPRLSPGERLQRIPAIDLARIRLSPDEAIARALGLQGQQSPPPDNAQAQTPAPSAPDSQAQRGNRGERGARAGDAGQRRGDGSRRGTRGAGPRGRGGRGGGGADAPNTAPAGPRGGRGGPGRVEIGAFLDRPVYRIAGRLVFADDGSVLDEVTPETAKRIAARFMNVSVDKLRHTMLTEVDQWTVGQRRQLPLHKISVDDGSGTELYISPESGDVMQMTTRGSRALAWVAAIPHWLYFTSLRSNQSLWYQTVVWASVLGCVLALAGIALSVTQLKIRRPFRWSKVLSYIPYSGWMRWHYIGGSIFGVLTLTWVFSGLLSMEPLGWAAGPTLQGNLRGLLTGGPLDAAEFPRIDADAFKRLLPDRAIKEIEYARIQGDPFFVVRSAPIGPAETRVTDRTRQEYSINYAADPNRTLIDARTMRVRTEPFSVESLMSRVKAAFPDAPILESALLNEYDSYYYSRDRQAPLPVLRVKFGDEVQTWIYIDPQMSQQVAAVHRLDRVERWIYNGFHSLDFAFWYYNGPVWYTGVIVLSLGGAFVSFLGMCIGFKRVLRGAKRVVYGQSGERVAVRAD